jgi:AraC-like DNA-binding protein
MKKTVNTPYIINSISVLHRLLELGKPEHPLVSVIDFATIRCFDDEKLRSVSYNFYCIALKKNFEGKMKYGQHYYDFDEGMMSFFSPGQVITTDVVENLKLEGWMLVIHPDYLRNYPLAQRIKEYGYFSYALHEALHLSDKEEAMINTMMINIRQEYLSAIDTFSQDVIIAHLELLLNYCNRFYNRQFLTRKAPGNDLLIRFEALLAAYLNSGRAQEAGLPKVQYFADQLNLSPSYLSDLLRSLTGQGTQQHIHHKVIERAKEMLTTTSLSVGEIAYQLGFEYPQSFNKLFKSKTNVSPLEFRQSFN